jgi:hypothetical protein
VTVDLEEFFTGDAASWLNTLPSYQRTTVDILLASGKSYDDVAEAWLSASVAHETHGFGVGESAKIFYAKVLDEIHDLICTGKGYEDEQKRVLAEFKQGKTLVAATVTEAISPHVGSYAAFLSVAVVCALSSITKVGKNAWCAMQSERRRAENQQPPSGNLTA